MFNYFQNHNFYASIFIFLKFIFLWNWINWLLAPKIQRLITKKDEIAETTSSKLVNLFGKIRIGDFKYR